MLCVKEFTEKSWADGCCCLSWFYFIYNAWMNYVYRDETW